MKSIRLASDAAAAAGTPMFRQIYQRMRSAILNGDMLPGTRVPSWNDLANELKVSRGTVKAAYDCLAGEGFLIGRGAAGTFVNAALTSVRESKRAARRTQAAPVKAEAQLEAGFGLGSRGGNSRPFQMGVPAFDVFPRTLWSRLVTRRARVLHPDNMAYPHAAGDPQLRAALAGYLAVARGLACHADQVFITTGYKGALDLIARVLLKADDTVLVEDPCYPPARIAMEMAGARITPVSVDDQGMDIDSLSQRTKQGRLAIVTPSHHAPLGMPLSLPRRLALLDWAAHERAWIIEDDYYGEFRLQGRPLPALASLNQDRVLYVGTFSKVLIPSLRLGYVVVPQGLQTAFLRTAHYLAPSPAALLQAAAADFMQQGHFARHVRRMASIYSARRMALIKALRSHFERGDELRLRESALHVTLSLPLRCNDVNIATRAAKLGLAPSALSPWFVKAKAESGLLLSFANIPEKDAARHVKQLNTITTARVKPVRRGAPNPS